MEIRILHLLEGARNAKGLTVIIDVFRAFSTACFVFDNGAGAIIPIGDQARAYQLKEAHPDFILIGERDGKMLPGFDFGNSPAEIEHVNFRGKTVIQTTSAGTQGIVNAAGASRIITGSFNNAGAVAGYIKSQNPGAVSLVAMGHAGIRRTRRLGSYERCHAGIRRTDEDILCAQYIRSLLKDDPLSPAAIKQHLRKSPGSQKFFDPQMPWFRERDFELCLSFNRFNFVLVVRPHEGDLLCLKRQDLPPAKIG
ncbi:MAG: 2-phosphosulfolactate phosphatase [Calditrichia bacterium]